MTVSRKLTILTVFGMAIVLGLSYLADHHPTSAIPAKIAQTGDSLTRTRPALVASLDQSAKERGVSAAAQRALLERERMSRRRADSLARRADSLATLADEIVTTSNQWSMAYAARTAEADALRSALADASARGDSLAADTLRLHDDNRATMARMLALERFNATLGTALQKATECRIVGPVRCPSRVQVAVAVVALDRLLPLMVR